MDEYVLQEISYFDDLNPYPALCDVHNPISIETTIKMVRSCGWQSPIVGQFYNLYGDMLIV